MQNNTPAAKRTSLIGNFFDNLELFCYVLAFLVIVFTFLFRYVSVDGKSMTDTLQDKDMLIISGLFYTPETGDIVVIKSDPIPIIKRIIATEGQLVEIDFDNWIVKVDGKELNESYVRRVGGGMLHDENYSGPFYVEKGKIFVMGDNRTGSKDSRTLGQLNAADILGRVVLRVYPFGTFGRVR